MKHTTLAKNHNVHPVTAAALLVTVGIVFGDIGTSPLYVMKAITGANPAYDADYIIGAISCIIWTLTLQTTIKYVLIALRADNHGEGGILALYSLVKKLKSKWLYIPAAIGAGTLIADGVITPAVTVTSAIEGLRTLEPSAPVIPIVILIISLIFIVQRHGTNAIGRLFGPIMLIWFLTLGITGASQIAGNFEVLKAFNPIYACKLLISSPQWFLILGAVFLCTTGAEALYSDMGHCGRWNITWSWLLVKIMLITNYLGQGAYLLSITSEAHSSLGNPFYAIMPQWFLPIGIILATCAAIIASQALLSGSFTLFSEAMGLDFWPKLKVKYPSPVKGQLYIPIVNISLYIGCILTVLMFKTSSAMEAAYGLAITITMLMTTILLSFYMHSRRVKLWITLSFTSVFMLLEGVFFVANAAKFLHGGWYTILLATIVTAGMILWRRALITRAKYVQYKKFSDCFDIIKAISTDKEIPKYASNAVYFSNSKDPDLVESKLVYSIIRKFPKRADHYWIVRINYSDVPDELQYTYHTLIPGLLISIEINIGFRVNPQVNVYLRQIISDIVDKGEIDLTSTYPSLKKHNIQGDFRFVMIHRIFSPSSNCSPADRRAMWVYKWLGKMGQYKETELGLDTSNLTIETVPLIINTHPPRKIVPASPSDFQNEK